MTEAAFHIVAVVAIALAALALLLAIGAQARSLRLRRAFRAAGAGRASVPEVLDRQAREIDELRVRLAAAGAEAQRLRVEVAQSLRHVAVVRYDAFGDLGGRLSFSAALLDDTGDGVVLSSVAGRHESRSYAKAVRAAEGVQELSPEESEAVALAAGRARLPERQSA